MDKWRCIPFDYIYDHAEGDEEGGITPGIVFEDFSDDWVRPICNVGKNEFEKAE